MEKKVKLTNEDLELMQQILLEELMRQEDDGGSANPKLVELTAKMKLILKQRVK